MATVWKVIKPSRLRDDRMRLALLNEMRKVGRAIKKDFEATTETWDNKPEFEMLISLAKLGPTVLVDTNDPIYRYVSEGTRRHFVEPKRAQALAFPGTYTAKTIPGVISSKGGGKGGPTVFSKGHWVSGIKARKFDSLIARKWQPKFKRAIEGAMRQARKDSGHAI